MAAEAHQGGPADRAETSEDGVVVVVGWGDERVSVGGRRERSSGESAERPAR